MASSVATTFHSAADGEQFNAAAWRLGSTSHAGVTNDGADALKSRPGILSGFGTPLDVTQLGSPAMQVTVKKGTVFQQSSSATGGVYSHSLTSDTNLDIAPAHATNPRLDAVVATVFDDGTSASNTKIEVLTGVAGASPTLPPALSSPPSNTHYFPLAQVRVEAAVTSIVTAKITKPAASGGLPTFGQFTCAPGGAVRGVTREWVATRSTEDLVGPAASGSIVQVTVPSAEALPGIYVVQACGGYKAESGSGTNAVRHQLTTPTRTRTGYMEVVTGGWFWTTMTDTFVLQTGPGAAQVFGMNVINSSGTNNIRVGFPDPNASIIVTRVADF